MELVDGRRGPSTSPKLAGVDRATSSGPTTPAWPHSSPDLAPCGGEATKRGSCSELLRRRQRFGGRELKLSSLRLVPPEKRSFQDWLVESFDVHGTLGQGAASLVLRATRRSDGREVALKTTASPDVEVASFCRREFETLRRLKHPNIVQALDFLSFRGRSVLVLEYVNGLPLNEFLRRQAVRRLAEDAARRLTRQLVLTVEYLHRHGVLHRDIKPENVLVTEDTGYLCLIDFNTAFCLSTGNSLTPTGTRVYAAPEVVLGEPPSTEADVWGIGVCAFVMLSGHLPQNRGDCGYSQSKLEQAAHRPVDFPQPAWETVSEPCRAVLRRCLSLHPCERATPAELLGMAWLHETHEDSLLVPVRKVRSDEHGKCLLLPGLESAEAPTTPATCHSAGTPSTALPSSRGSIAFAPQTELEDPLLSVHAVCGYQVPAVQELLDLGAHLRIQQPKSDGARPFELWTRVGMEAVILLVDVSKRVYKVRFADGQTCCVPFEHAIAAPKPIGA